MPVNFDSSKKEIPCFHRTISIQIDSPLPHDDTQAVQDNLIFDWIIKALQISYSTSSVCDFG